jgi:hypothetical protein
MPLCQDLHLKNTAGVMLSKTLEKYKIYQKVMVAQVNKSQGRNKNMTG